jgi:alpha-beta hydrolase superfamily lysophospholipase
MGHGFGAERRFRLPAFAERLCAAGLAVLLFDYRGFGDSEGTPRGLVDPGRHLADFAAAVRYAQELKGVDGARLALWGTFLSGGHALVTAARLPGIALRDASAGREPGRPAIPLRRADSRRYSDENCDHINRNRV